MTKKYHWLIFDVTENVRISIETFGGTGKIYTEIYDKDITPEHTVNTRQEVPAAAALQAIRNLYRIRHRLYNYYAMS